MQIYLVGGAVRDHLLHLPVHERDWVVVGATVDDLLAQGYKQVGKDFPVFIHPNSGEEYALARTERKSAKGHQGFIVHSSPDISLQQDLIRRDLTINAIAQDKDQTLIDPYGGQQDLQQRILRHVSPAFAEDPLRVLRVARFAAKFACLNFKIAPETMLLMQKISDSGELAHLSKERVWQETRRALETKNPEVYFQTLFSVGALQVIAPELATQFNYQDKLSRLSRLHIISDVDSRYVALVMLASEQSNGFSTELSNTINRSFASPRALQELSTLATKHFLSCNNALNLDSYDIHSLLHKLDGFRRSDRYAQILKCMQNAYVVLHMEISTSIVFLSSLLPRLTEIKLPDDELRELDGQAIAEALTKLRCQAIDQIRQKFLDEQKQ